jgi:arsenate reductase
MQRRAKSGTETVALGLPRQGNDRRPGVVEGALWISSRYREDGMKRILFLCTGNSCRSQMAQVIMNWLGKGRFEALSAGSKPSGYVHPLAIKTLEDSHLPTEGLRSKSWEEFEGQTFDFILTVCDWAKESCPVWPGQPITAHWGFEDPAEATGTDEQKERVFRKVFAEIQTRIRLFIALSMESLPHFELEKRVNTIGKETL